MDAVLQKFKETEAEMTERLTKSVSDLNRQKDLVSSTLELSCGSFQIWKREQEYQTSSLLAEVTRFTEN